MTLDNICYVLCICASTLILFGTGISAFAADGEPAKPAAKAESSCYKFNALFQDDSSFTRVSAITAEDRRVHFSLGSFYTDQNNETLYGLFSVTRSDERFIAVLRLYPGLEFLFMVPRGTDKKTFPKEIEDFIAPLKWTRSGQWWKRIGFDNQCEPLANPIAKVAFDDGKWRHFIRHFPFGKRVTKTRYGCEIWGVTPDQLRFYESFVPDFYDLKDGRVFIDREYAGVLKDGEFEYPCDLKNYVDAREKILDSDSAKPARTFDYLARKNIIDSQEKPKTWKPWELQVLRNIVEGHELYNNPPE